MSDEALRVEEGSLYPALHRMEHLGWIAADWRITAKNRRARYYRLTRAGEKRLAEEQDKWVRLTDGALRSRHPPVSSAEATVTLGPTVAGRNAARVSQR